MNKDEVLQEIAKYPIEVFGDIDLAIRKLDAIKTLATEALIPDVKECQYGTNPEPAEIPTERPHADSFSETVFTLEDIKRILYANSFMYCSCVFKRRTRIIHKSVQELLKEFKKDLNVSTKVQK